jgi:hypothetical protein
MVVEKTVVENRSVGNRWFISLEKELREETGAKYPDKTVIHVSLEGYEDDYEAARLSLEQAKLQLEKLIEKQE